MGGGKSYIEAFISIGLATDYPKTRYAVIRKNLSTLKRTTLQTFKKVAHELNLDYKHNKADSYFEFPNESRIYFVEADYTTDSDFNKLKGFELTAAMIDEANEVHESAFNILKARIGRENPGGAPDFIMLTCNPDTNWVKDTFYDPWANGTLKDPYYFLQALPHDNPYLSREYLQGLEDLPTAEYNRYVLGDWSYSDDPNQLVKYEWVKNNLCNPAEEADALGIDVARTGSDKTIVAYTKEKRLVKLEEIDTDDTMVVASRVKLIMEQYGVGYQNVKVDVVGVGGGVADRLKEYGLPVLNYMSGYAADTVEGALLFKNKRAEDYWRLREGLRNNEYKIIDDKELIKELTNIRYFVKDRYIQIESKEEIKKRLGYSPDRADAAVIAFANIKTNNFGFVI
jgi:hypothetical protein